MKGEGTGGGREGRGEISEYAHLRREGGREGGVSSLDTCTGCKAALAGWRTEQCKVQNYHGISFLR